MRPSRLSALLLVALVPCASLAAQAIGGAPVAPSSLTVDQAVELALQNNWQVRQARNETRNAAAAVRSAYGALLPNVNASAGMGWREGRAQVFGGQAIGAASNTIGSNGSINGNLNLGLDRLAQPEAARAAQRSVEATLGSTRNTVRLNVTTQFHQSLRSEYNAALQDSLVASTRLQVELAQARAAVGTGNQLDVQRAQVALGQQRLRAVQARAQATADRLELFNRMGVVAPPGDVTLQNTLAVVDVPLSLDELLQQARRANPDVGVQSAELEARTRDQRVTRLSYLPQLQLTAGYGGFTNQFTDQSFVVNNALASKQSPCRQQSAVLGIVGQPQPDCSLITLTPQERQAAIDRNATWPFSFTRNPYAINVGVSLPLFDGFQRGQRLQQAEVARDNAREQLRRQQVQVEATVRTVHANLLAARDGATIAAENSATARTALTLAEARYRAGVATFLDVSTARDDYARAEADRINAVASFVDQLAQLEAVIGRRLR